MLERHTIAAIATAAGNSAIGIIRINGKNALNIASQVFQSKKSLKNSPSRVVFGDVIVAGKKVDQALAIYFKAPNSYTGEDLIELHCHGGFILLNLILNHIISIGAKLALPGEFTKLAFLNGKIDLNMAESVNELITSQSLTTAALFFEQLTGKLSNRIKDIKEQLMLIQAEVNAAIDFSDEDIAFTEKHKFSESVANILNEIDNDLNSANSSIAWHHGFKLAIVGAPNVGKSSLFNALISEDRAIVSEIAGTTRDTINHYLDINGVTMEILDTAGIRESTDKIESLGIERSLAVAKNADLVLFIYDATKSDELDLLERIINKHIVVANKIDIVKDKTIINKNHVAVSATQKSGLAELKAKIHALIINDLKPENALIFNNRQKNLLQNCSKSLQNLLKILNAPKFEEELVALEINFILDLLAEILGETSNEDVLDIIFSKFCIGK